MWLARRDSASLLQLLAVTCESGKRRGQVPRPRSFAANNSIPTSDSHRDDAFCIMVRLTICLSSRNLISNRAFLSRCRQRGRPNPKEQIMFGKVTVLSAAALLVSGVALAQQQPSPSQPQQSPSPSASSQCWDTATNQVRNRTAAAPNAPSSNQPGNTVGAGNPNPSGAAPSQAPGSAANRPAGMPNC